jgi:2-polyprenyl-3-methyl-5-hydroxy-6-metoxy-1,4-benzoquinol methylase
MSGYVPLNERRHRAHAKLLAAVGTGRRVLDVGCSSGYLAEPLSERGNTIVGIELDPAAAREAERFCERVLVGDVETMELPLEPGSFDVVLCGDVVEHLRDPVASLARLRPLLKPGGRLVLSTPNVANWAIRLALLGGRWRYTDRGILDRSHTHLFTRATLIAALRRAGYDRIEVDFSVPVPGDSDALDAAAYAVGRLRPPLFAYQWIAVAQTSS